MSDENQLDSYDNTLTNAGEAAEDQLPQLEHSLDEDNSSMFRDSLGFRHGGEITLGFEVQPDELNDDGGMVLSGDRVESPIHRYL